MSAIEVLPTYVPRDSEDLAAGLDTIRAFASAVHIDVDDGVLAPHLTWPYTSTGVFGEVSLASAHDLFVEMHLMADAPVDLGIAFARAGAKRIIGHFEGFRGVDDARAALARWKQAGAAEVGLGLLWQTDIAALKPLIPECDVVHLMSIARIGTQGIPYEPSAPERIAEFHRTYPDTIISVDGGVSRDNIGALARAGATHFGVGSAISRAPAPADAYNELLRLAQEAVQ